jgi:hypothetical protein
MICDRKAIGVGFSSRQGAKALRLWGKDKNFYKRLSPIISDLGALCGFARDIPIFGCGFVALGPSW